MCRALEFGGMPGDSAVIEAIAHFDSRLVSERTRNGIAAAENASGGPVVRHWAGRPSRLRKPLSRLD